MDSLKKIKNSEKDQIAANIQKFVKDEYLVEIGRVISQWSTLEEMVSAAIWQAAGVRNDIGRIITTQLQMMSKVDLLGTLLHHKKPFLGVQFDKVANYIKNELSGRRNTVAHGHWLVGNDEWAIVNKFTAKGKFADKSRMMLISDLKELSRDISETTFWVLTLCAALPKLKQRPSGQDPEHDQKRIQTLLGVPTQSTPKPPPLMRRASTRKKPQRKPPRG